MRFGSYDTEDQVWIRDQTARIFHRHVLSGKHFRIDVEALLSRVARLRASIPAESNPQRRPRRLPLLLDHSGEAALSTTERSPVWKRKQRLTT